MGINEHEYANIRPMPSINMMLLVQYDSLGLEIVYLWILTSFLSFLMFSLKIMNMQIKLKGQCLSFKWGQIQSRVSNSGNMTDLYVHLHVQESL